MPHAMLMGPRCTMLKLVSVGVVLQQDHLGTAISDAHMFGHRQV